MVEWKQTVGCDFFENKLLQQPDVVFNSELNGSNFSSLALPGGEKKIIFNFFQTDVTSRRLRTIIDFMTELKFEKKSDLISRTPRGHMTSYQKI